jgi:hypothetical protein
MMTPFTDKLPFRIVFFLLLVVFAFPAMAQEEKEPRDTVKIYENIRNLSEANSFTQFLYRLIFNPAASDDHLEFQEGVLSMHNIYGIYEGKIIRKIHVYALDPFGTSPLDTLSFPAGFVQRAGNTLHINTRKHVLTNLMLIKEGQPFNSWVVKESERLIRSRRYVNDVYVYINQPGADSDSVDIVVVALDRWSIIPEGSVSDSRLSAGVRETNFAGWGHDLYAGVRWNHETGKYDLRSRYFIPNIENTFINAVVQFSNLEHGNQIRQIAFERPFFSPFARWAGGIDLGLYQRTDSFFTPIYRSYRYKSQDFWGGLSERVYGGDTEYRRTTNFIAAARYMRVRFTDRPVLPDQTRHYFVNEDLFLATVGLSARRYIRDQFVFRYGVTEDIAVGQLLSIISGYQIRKTGNRYYLGGQFSQSDYYQWGYLGAYFDYGSFLTPDASTQEGIINIGMNYFTPLLDIGSWHVRQFLKPEATFGFDRAPWDSLTINRENGIRGFNSPSLSGSHRLMLTSQTQVYAPWNVIGFRFGPFLYIKMAMLANKEGSFSKSRLFSQMGLGVLVRNDNLVLSTFQFSFSFYPSIPDRGNNIFRFNTFQTTDYDFRDFEVRKPAPITFR